MEALVQAALEPIQVDAVHWQCPCCGAADFPSELGVRMHLKNTASCVNQSHLQRTRALKRRLSRRGLDAEAPEHKAPRLAIPALVPPAPDAEADRRVALAQLVEALAAHALGSKGEHLCDTLTLPLCPPLLEYNVRAVVWPLVQRVADHYPLLYLAQEIALRCAQLQLPQPWLHWQPMMAPPTNAPLRPTPPPELAAHIEAVAEHMLVARADLLRDWLILALFPAWPILRHVEPAEGWYRGILERVARECGARFRSPEALRAVILATYDDADDDLQLQEWPSGMLYL